MYFIHSSCEQDVLTKDLPIFTAQEVVSSHKAASFLIRSARSMVANAGLACRVVCLSSHHQEQSNIHKRSISAPASPEICGQLPCHHARDNQIDQQIAGKVKLKMDEIAETARCFCATKHQQLTVVTHPPQLLLRLLLGGGVRCEK